MCREEPKFCYIRLDVLYALCVLCNAGVKIIEEHGKCGKTRDRGAQELYLAGVYMYHVRFLMAVCFKCTHIRLRLSDNRSEGGHLGHNICNNYDELHPPYRIVYEVNVGAVHLFPLEGEYCASGLVFVETGKRLFGSRLELCLATLVYLFFRRR